MTEFEIEVIEAAMEFAAMDSALNCGVPVQQQRKKAERGLIDACANLAAENEGQWRAPEPTAA